MSETANRPPRLEHAEGFSQHLVFVGREVDDTIRDDDIDSVIRQRDVLDFSLQKLYILNSGLPSIFSGQRQHFIRHVQTIGLAGRPHPLAGQQHINAPA